MVSGKRLLRHIFTACIFPLSDNVFGIYLMFLCTIFIWPCDLDGVWRIKSLICPTHLPILSILWLSVPELCVTQFDHITITGTVTAHAPCHWGGGKNYPHFWNPWPKFTYSFCNFQGATTKFKPCYGRKIAFIPLSRLQSSLRMRSITWPVHRGSPKTTRSNFSPRLIYSLYNFYGATMTNKDSFILEHQHVKAVFGRKKTVLSKSVPKMEVFRKFKGLNIKYSHRDPQKALLYSERRVPTYFA